ncbi:hypothetical protein [Dehalobacter sp. TeCB1]|uniref:hypothetical protein n=1 Tax=Dehalobacter sp. TeCB1 TaxID=1843715 RepID=UPI00159F3133|nr:hypothetical protein [Dehalobacter sp. TeCB1]
MKVKYQGEYYIVTLIPRGKYFSYQIIRERTGNSVTDKKILAAVADRARRKRG